MSIIQRLSEVQNLPTLPEIVLRIQQLIMSEEGNATMLARIIQQDLSLSAKVLKVANSAFYCTKNGKASSINMAITRIGFNEVGRIALAANFVRRFSHRSAILDYHIFWKHSLTAAYFCSGLTAHIRDRRFFPRDQHIMFLAGLLHDIGILVYDQFFHKEFEAIISKAINNELSFLVAEQQQTPTEMHAALGGALLSLWKIDPSVTAAVRFHHAPDKAPESFRHLASVAYLAELYLCTMVIGSFEGSMERRPLDPFEELGLTHDQVLEQMRTAQNEVENSDLMLAFDKEAATSSFRAI